MSIVREPHFTCEECVYTVLYLYGKEKIGQPFEFRLKLIVEDFSVGQRWLGEKSVLTHYGTGDSFKDHAGVVMGVDVEKRTNENKWLIEVKFTSSMALLALQGGVAFYYQRTLVECWKEKLASIGWLPKAQNFYTQEEKLKKEFSYQTEEESDLAYLNRLAGQTNTIWFTETIEKTEHFVFFSNSQRASKHDFEGMVCAPKGFEVRMSLDYEGLYLLEDIVAYLPNEQKHLEERKVFCTRFAGLKVGHQIKIKKRDYFVYQLEHNYAEHFYEIKGAVIPLEIPYLNKPLKPKPPTWLRGHIVAHPTTQSVYDNHGNYYVKFFDDMNESEDQETRRVGIPRILPDGGLPSESGQPTGWFMPLQAGEEVCVGFIENNPDEPVIIGCLPNSEHPSNVTKENLNTYIWQTENGQKILFQEPDNQPKELLIATKEDLQQIKMTESEEHAEILIQSRGQLTCHAKEKITIASERDCYQSIGQERRIEIGENLSCEIEQGDFILESQKNINITAKKAMKFDTAKNIDLFSKEGVKIECGGAHIVSKKGNITFQTQQGELSIFAGKKICIQADEIQLVTPTAAIKMDRGGKIHFAAKEIHLKAESIEWHGCIDLAEGEPQRFDRSKSVFNQEEKNHDFAQKESTNEAYSQTKGLIFQDEYEKALYEVESKNHLFANYQYLARTKNDTEFEGTISKKAFVELEIADLREIRLVKSNEVKKT